MGDVHSPICQEVNLPYQVLNAPMADNRNYEKIRFRSKWVPELSEQYQNMFLDIDLDILRGKISHICRSPNPTADEVNQLAADLTTIILEPAKSLGMCKKIGT